MNGWKILEVVLGMTFVYLLLSLIASALLEWLISSWLHKLTGVLKRLAIGPLAWGWKWVGVALAWKGTDWLRSLHTRAARTGAGFLNSVALPPRHELLEKALQELLGPRVCEQFYRHRLLRGIAEKNRKPSYISPQTFRLVLMDLAMGEYRKQAGPEFEAAFIANHLERMVSASARPVEAAKAMEGVAENLVESKES